jgi:Mn-dependent DtxR family transcriptional regulator
MLSEKLEMYLKTILILEREYNPVRVSLIAKARGVSAASATEAIQTLREKDLILHRAYRGVRLSAKGRRIARRIEARHEVLLRSLTKILGMDKRKATRDACEIEHVASPETMERLAALLEFIDRRGERLSELIADFHEDYTMRTKEDS